MYGDIYGLSERDEARMGIAVMVVALTCLGYLFFEIYKKTTQVTTTPTMTETNSSSIGSHERFNAISAGFAGK